MRKVIILGTGGQSVDILDTIADMKDTGEDVECVGFLDDNKDLWGKEIGGVKVLGSLKKASSFSEVWFVNGIGTSTNFVLKEKIVRSTQVPARRFISLIHPTASVSRTAKIGRGAVIFQNVTITANVKVGRHVVVLPQSVLSHDSQIGDYTCIAGGVCISGRVKIGKSCYLGTNSAIKDGLRVGGGSLVGMGSVVLNDVARNSVMVGNPARLLRRVIYEKKR